MKPKTERKMNHCILGIDLGTSSVKILKKYQDGSVKKLKNTDFCNEKRPRQMAGIRKTVLAQ